MADNNNKVHVMIVYENANYKIDIGESLLLEGASVYRAINKYTGVMEVEDQMLPRIVDYANQLDEKIGELQEEGLLSYRLEDTPTKEVSH
jgi:hypothetical protein